MQQESKFTFDLSNFNCSLCYELPKNPLESVCCQSIFCKYCIISIDKCPLCRSYPLKLQENKLFNKLLKQIPRLCQQCNQMQFDIDEHYKICQQKIYYCSGNNNKCEFKGKQNQYYEHIQQYHSHQIIQAFQCMLMINNINKIGTVQGYYIYNYNKYEVKGNFVIDNCLVTINSEDSVGKAIWNGYIKLVDFEIKLKKTYLQQHTIIYKGYFDQNIKILKGKWKIQDIEDIFELEFISQ